MDWWKKKNDYNTTITDNENKIPSAFDLVTTGKVIETEYKIPNITNLAVKAALNTKAAEIKNKKNLILVNLLIKKNKTG